MVSYFFLKVTAVIRDHRQYFHPVTKQSNEEDALYFHEHFRIKIKKQINPKTTKQTNEKAHSTPHHKKPLIPLS